VRIEDLTDERDKEHCRRAERAPSIRTFVLEYRGRAGFVEKPIPNYDARANQEFVTGIPAKQWEYSDFPGDGINNSPEFVEPLKKPIYGDFE
jgi:hypothetical protein